MFSYKLLTALLDEAKAKQDGVIAGTKGKLPTGSSLNNGVAKFVPWSRGQSVQHS